MWERVILVHASAAGHTPSPWSTEEGSWQFRRRHPVWREPNRRRRYLGAHVRAGRGLSRAYRSGGMSSRSGNPSCFVKWAMACGLAPISCWVCCVRRLPPRSGRRAMADVRCEFRSDGGTPECHHHVLPAPTRECRGSGVWWQRVRAGSCVISRFARPSRRSAAERRRFSSLRNRSIAPCSSRLMSGPAVVVGLRRGPGRTGSSPSAAWRQ
jgi:hypothetical protein